MTDETTLLPCPFCGGEAELHPSLAGFFVGCFNDGCEVNPHSGEFVYDGVWDKEQEQAAIAAWNARAAYETDGYFLLPKPKERLYSLTGPVFSDDCMKASFGVSVFDDAVKRWQHQIEENMERELISRICEVFGNARAERTCYPTDCDAGEMDVDVYALSCGHVAYYPSAYEDVPSYCPECGARNEVDE